MLFSIHAKNSENRQTEILLQQTAAHNGALLSVLHKKLKCLSFVRKKNIFVIVGRTESSWKCIPKVQANCRHFSARVISDTLIIIAGKKKGGISPVLCNNRPNKSCTIPLESDILIFSVNLNNLLDPFLCNTAAAAAQQQQ